MIGYMDTPEGQTWHERFEERKKILLGPHPEEIIGH